MCGGDCDGGGCDEDCFIHTACSEWGFWLGALLHGVSSVAVLLARASSAK